MINKVKKVTGIVSYVIYVLILAAIIAILPTVAGYRPVAVLTESMESAYSKGSLLYYQATSFEELQAGDVITFETGNGSTATHRIVSKDDEEKSFITKGDNNEKEDINSVPYNMVFGKVKGFSVPFGGYYIYYISRWPVIVLMALILVVNIVLNLNKRDHEEVKQIDEETQPQEKVKKEKPKKTKKTKEESAKVSASEFFKDL